jgi:hypothetical protein
MCEELSGNQRVPYIGKTGRCKEKASDDYRHSAAESSGLGRCSDHMKTFKKGAEPHLLF